MKYDNIFEFKKISEAFMRVKEDVGKSFNLIAQNSKTIEKLEREILLLREQVILNSKVILENAENTEKKKIVGNKDSKKYHYDICPFAKRIKKSNLKKFRSQNEAKKQGYVECSCIKEF